MMTAVIILIVFVAVTMILRMKSDKESMKGRMNDEDAYKALLQKTQGDKTGMDASERALQSIREIENLSERVNRPPVSPSSKGSSAQKLPEKPPMEGKAVPGELDKPAITPPPRPAAAPAKPPETPLQSRIVDRLHVLVRDDQYVVEALKDKRIGWRMSYGQDSMLEFDYACQIKPRVFGNPLVNCRYRVFERLFEDLSFVEGETVEEFPDQCAIRRSADGTLFLYARDDIPTFDSGDRDWDSTAQTVVYCDSRGINLIFCRHGYGIPKIYVYTGMTKAFPAFMTWLERLGCANRVGKANCILGSSLLEQDRRLYKGILIFKAGSPFLTQAQRVQSLLRKHDILVDSILDDNLEPSILTIVVGQAGTLFDDTGALRDDVPRCELQADYKKALPQNLFSMTNSMIARFNYARTPEKQVLYFRSCGAFSEEVTREEYLRWRPDEADTADGAGQTSN